MSTIKTAISIQETLFEQVEKLARQLNISRSALVGIAVEEYLERHQNQKLLEKLNQAYATEPDYADQQRLTRTRRSHRRIVEGEW